VELVFPEEQAIQLLRAADAPTRAYITIHRCRVTRAGRARGIEPADLLKRVLDLAGLSRDATRANLAVADPR
jgi:hypothetical protein